MTERRYSISELIAMRKHIKELLHDWQATGACGAMARRSPSLEDIELQLATYMRNGTGPEELEDAVNAAAARLEKEQASFLSGNCK
jgi:hypothetical protein